MVPPLNSAWNSGITVRPSLPLVGGALDIHRDVTHADAETEEREPGDDHRRHVEGGADAGDRQDRARPRSR